MTQSQFDKHVGNVREAFAYYPWARPLWEAFKHEMSLYAERFGLCSGCLQSRH